MSLDTAVSGLVAFQRALATVSHNITNATTEGYSRQRVELGSRTPELIGGGYVGKGVQTSAITRAYDSFVVQQVFQRTANYSELEKFGEISTQLDTLLGDPNIGLTKTLQEFFDSVQDLTTDPSSLPARQVVISRAESLSTRFHSLNQQFDDLRSNVNSQLGIVVEQVNVLAESIADVNLDIVRSKGAAGGGEPNDLLDQRDRLVQSLSKLVDVRVNYVADGSMNVYIGTGQSLVLGSNANTLGITTNNFDASQKEVSLIVGSNSTPISDLISGGQLGGLLSARDEVIHPIQLDLGLIAMSIASAFNTQHQAGDDLAGNAGANFFTALEVSSPSVLSNGNNNPTSGTVTITIDDVQQVKASDYRLFYDGTNYTLIRDTDTVTVDTFTAADFPRTIASEGITLGISGAHVAGDSFLVRPTRYSAGQAGVLISDVSEIAAASSGSPSGNNQNALALAALQTTKYVSGGTATFQESYGQMVSDVGIKTSQGEIDRQAQRALLNQATETRSSISGVNLDEEAASLLQYQQAYQATARVISVLDSLFQTLISAIGR